MSLLKNIEFLRHLPKVGQIDLGDRLAPASRPGATRLVEQRGFGSNPGALRMFSYVPPGLHKGAALVVVLHGCTQTAASYDTGAGWSMLAERYGFALLMPQQVQANNPNG